MKETYYIKLISGEDLIAKVEDLQGDSRTMNLEDPMFIQYFQAGGGGYQAGMRPWIPGLSDKEHYTIFKRHTMFMSRLENNSLLEFYEKVVEKNRNTDFEHVVEGEDDDDGPETAEEVFDRIAANTITGPQPDNIH